jgi:prepilin-type N-terminal cleavage/methylation domain-containing protein
MEGVKDVRAGIGAARGRPLGFTLIELMLVVTLLAILIVMAIPGLAGSRKHANEASAISNLRSISSMQNVYRVRFGAYGSLADLINAGCVDDSFADGQKTGYAYNTPNAPSQITWSVSANPVTPGTSGDRWFYVDESGVIRFREGGAATPADSAVQ